MNGARCEDEEAHLWCSAEIEQACLLRADTDYKSILAVFKRGHEDSVFWFLKCPQTSCTENKALLPNTSGLHSKTTAFCFLFQSKKRLITRPPMTGLINKNKNNCYCPSTVQTHRGSAVVRMAACIWGKTGCEAQ